MAGLLCYRLLAASAGCYRSAHCRLTGRHRARPAPPWPGRADGWSSQGDILPLDPSISL